MDIAGPEIQRYLDDLRRLVNEHLAKCSQARFGVPGRLEEAIQYSLLAPCKRIRPLLTIISADLCGADRLLSMTAACAVEMVHTYSLIHDDLPAMDNDDLRRGRPTCHIQFDEATAILAGDALLALAFETLALGIPSTSLAGACCGVLAESAGPAQLVGGQADDMYAEETVERLGVADRIRLLESIHQRKTGALIRAALRLGGLVGRASEDHLFALDAYGQHFGLAFQMTDDLLDWLGEENLVGKRLRKDSAQKKLAFPELLGIERTRLGIQEEVEKACKVLAVFDSDLAESEQEGGKRGQEAYLAYQTLLALVQYLPTREN